LYLVTSVLKPVPATSLCCVDPATGKEQWRKPIGYYHAAPMRLAGNRLLVLDDAGNLKLLEADPKEYKELAKAKVCGGTLIAPALANGRLYARDDKELVCVQLSD
jgi:outer membrane protein assembly factor BamB